MMYFRLLLLSACLGLYACSKEESPAPATAPAIGIISISPDTLVQFQDSVVIVLQYEDVNGDIGSIDPDVNDLEVKDSRLQAADYYHIQPLAPEGTSLFIQGTIRVVLPAPFLLGNGDAETINYSVRLRDQNGAWSEEASADPIVVIRE